jgi:hypothetical protein
VSCKFVHYSLAKGLVLRLLKTVQTSCDFEQGGQAGAGQ